MYAPGIATNNLTFFAVRDLIAGIYFYGQIYRRFQEDLLFSKILKPSHRFEKMGKYLASF